jgi:proliferating cell nuclear antigen PCNA
LLRALQGAGNMDTVTLKMDGMQNVLRIYIESTRRSIEMELKLIHIQEDQLEVPAIEYHYEINLLAAHFAKVVKDLSQFGDNLKINSCESSVKFSVDGLLCNGVTTFRNKGKNPETCVQIVVRNELGVDKESQKFAIKYLRTFSKCSSFAEKVS